MTTVVVAVVAALVLVSATTWAWRSSGRATPRRTDVKSVEYAAQWVDRDQPHNSSTCMQMGFEHKIGW